MTQLIGKRGHYLLEFYGDFVSDLSSLGVGGEVVCCYVCVLCLCIWSG